MAQEIQTRTITVTVNSKPVELTVGHVKPEATGAEIKAAAIAQGVNIQPDFVLFDVRGPELKPVVDDQLIVVHPHQEFQAVAPDDNS